MVESETHCKHIQIVMAKKNKELRNSISSLPLKKKITRAIPGIIVMFFFIWLFTSVNIEDRNCNQALNENGVTILFYAESSRKGIAGNKNIKIYTKFSTIHNGKKLTARNNNFLRVVPEHLPIYVKYSFDCEDCYKFLVDSSVIYKGHLIEYPYIKNKGRDYRISKIE